MFRQRPAPPSYDDAVMTSRERQCACVAEEEEEGEGGDLDGEDGEEACSMVRDSTNWGTTFFLEGVNIFYVHMGQKWL